MSTISERVTQSMSRAMGKKRYQELYKAAETMFVIGVISLESFEDIQEYYFSHVFSETSGCVVAISPDDLENDDDDGYVVLYDSSAE